MMCDLASITFGWRRLAEAETFAERAVRIFDEDHRPDDPVLLHTFHVLFSIRLNRQDRPGQGSFQPIKLVRTERSEDSAPIHGLAGALLEAEGRVGRSSRGVLRCHQRLAAGRPWRNAETAAVMTNLACLYIKQRHCNDAVRVLDRALAIFASCKYATTLDRVKGLNLRGVLHARQREWPMRRTRQNPVKRRYRRRPNRQDFLHRANLMRLGPQELLCGCMGEARSNGLRIESGGSYSFSRSRDWPTIATIMTAYRIVRGTLCQGTTGRWGIQSGGIELEYPTGWRACLTGNNLANTFARDQNCTLDVDLEGGGQLRGVCSVVKLDREGLEVEADCEPSEFVEPIGAEPE